MNTNDEWLDTKTQELLQPSPPEKIAPPTSAQYCLILLDHGSDLSRMSRAVQRVNGCDDAGARKLLDGRPPLIVNAALCYYDALLGQFEFVCCDAIAVFIARKVAVGANPSYLQELFQKLRHSTEFTKIDIAMDAVPDTNDGQRFLDQFLGLALPHATALQFPLEMCVHWKKARIMAHWAARLGVSVRAMHQP